jgi:hypothetical protein
MEFPTRLKTFGCGVGCGWGGQVLDAGGGGGDTGMSCVHNETKEQASNADCTYRKSTIIPNVDRTFFPIDVCTGYSNKSSVSVVISLTTTMSKETD